MKKTLMFLLLAVMTVGAVVAQPSTKDRKLWKSCKSQAKTLKKEGWKVNGTMPLEEALFYHRKQLHPYVEKESAFEIISDVVGNTNVQTLNQGQQWALTNASILYAKQAKQYVAGRIAAELSGDIDTNGNPSLDNFYEGYESCVVKEIQGELKPSFMLYREKKDGGLDYKSYYVVNEDMALKARLRAMENAKIESEFARQHAEAVSNFVREGFVFEN